MQHSHRSLEVVTIRLFGNWRTWIRIGCASDRKHRGIPFSMLVSGRVSCYLIRLSTNPPADLWGNGTRTNSIRLLSLGTNIRTWPLACPKRFSDTATFSQRAIFSGGGRATICPLYTLLHDLFTKPVNSEHSSLKIRHQRAGATLETLKSYAQGRRKNRGLFFTRVKQKSS